MKLAAGLLVVVLLLGGAAWGQVEEKTASASVATVSIASSPQEAQARAQAVLDYWTPERMAAAVPKPTPTRVVVEGSMPLRAPAPAGPPTLINGWRPGAPPYVERVRTFSPEEARRLAGQAREAFGTAPTNPLSGPYGPFQRWTMEGNYLPYARGIHGKLFFTLGASNFVCSATVFGRSSIVTASHCLHGGGGSGTGWFDNWLFCPSYYNGGPGGTGIPHPSRGCWSWNAATISFPWLTSGDPDYDYACIVLSTTGTVIANKVGNVTGWAGRAANWVDMPEMIFGYPHAAPFTGQVIQQVATTDWYNWDAIPGGQVSKIVGNDLTGGSSGGGWFLSWRAPGAEFPDTDGNTGTDPAGVGGPFINGVNSHKRCLVNCASPPTAVNGVFWQEMSSPPFRLDGADPADSEDVFNNAFCLPHVNNNLP